MNITVLNEREHTTKNIILTGKIVSDLLNQLKINPEVVIVVRDNEVITEDEILHDQDKIELLSVVSGG